MVELLAPAGSYESFLGAIYAGADAVYAGGNLFGARAYAKNFTDEELLKAIDTAHIYGKKLYLAVNTLLKNKELEGQLYEYLMPFYRQGLDAVIVQDLGVMRFIRENFPELSIHASTQMTVTGKKGTAFLNREGVERIVAARELSLEEIQNMVCASSAEIEVFVHGALCYCYSGQCLFSSILGGRSGNRGRCAQPCRLPYQVSEDNQNFTGKKELCPLSPKDMCTLDLLPEIVQTGAASLKIEGRMKQPQYTMGVVSVYRKYLDLYFSNPEQYQVEETDRKFLMELFNRGGFHKGYFKQHNGPGMMAFTNEKKTGQPQVKVTKKTEKIKGNLILFPESPAILELDWKGQQAVISKGMVQKAQSQPVSRDRIKEQMAKSRNTPFVIQPLEIQKDQEIFLPVKVLNELRREGIEQIEREFLSKFRRNPVKPSWKEKKLSPPLEKEKIYVSCETREQAQVCLEQEQITGIYLPMKLMEEFLPMLKSKGKESYLAFPHVVRKEIPKEADQLCRKWLEQGMTGFLARNLETCCYLMEQGWQEKTVIDFSIYTWNDQAAAFWREHGILRNTVPLELNYKEILHRDNQDSELLIYGYLPLMESAQCVQKNLYSCTSREDQIRLKDRYEKHFPVQCCCKPWKPLNSRREDCYNIIYNSLPYGLLQEADQVKNLKMSSVRLSFTLENKKETRQILEEFLGVYRNSKSPSKRQLTKGHWKRGVE